MCGLGINPLEQGVIEGESPVFDPTIETKKPRTTGPPRVELLGIAALNGW